MTAPANLSDLPLLDDTILSEMAGMKNVGVVVVLVEAFLEEARDRVGAIARAVASNDIEGVGFQAHALKSTSRTYGAERLGEVAAEMESAAKVPDCGVIQDRGKLLDPLLAETEAAFRARFVPR